MSIEVSENKDVFLLSTNSTSYAFGVDDQGLLRHLYWGRKLTSVADLEMPPLTEVSTNDPVFEITREEFPVHGGLRYKEHCLKVIFADGTRELVYQYCGYDVTQSEEQEELILHLKDEHYAFYVDLHYVLHPAYDLMERSAVIRNEMSDPIQVEELYSAQFHIPYENLNFSNVHGHWGAEEQRFTQKVSYGKIVIENRRGISGHNHNPYFILDRDASETSGEVFFGALRRTGNFRGVVEQTPYGETLVQLGLNPSDCLIELAPGENFAAPAILFGYPHTGFETMSHNLHRFARDHIVHKGSRPVLYNSWEATEFHVNSRDQIKLAQKARELGAELFVLDDGWFGERHSIQNGLGDWYVNEGKFPNGLEELISEVKDLGMMFGIWVEPEMVNPKAQLYQQHPDWIYHYETRTSDTSRGQYLLNVTKPEVQEFIYNMMDNLLTRYDIDYVKWDANRPISQTGPQRDIWVRHIQTLYTIVDDLKKKHPEVLFEACASGGGRIDYGILGIFDDFWTSDNTDAYDRLYIQDAYSRIYPIKAMRAWVTDCPNFLSNRVIPLTFRFHSAMMGSLGIGCNILKFTPEEMELSKDMIRLYKEIRPIIQEGDFYRLENPSADDYFLYEYRKDNEGLLFAFLPQSKVGHRGTTVRLRDLDEQAMYTLHTKEGEITKSGSYLMYHGLDLHLNGDYASTIIRFECKQ
ncbi:alpha-galactosidase [Ruthenibacterium sp. CLA-JM-H11]|uniref:Alpha-galactosidase n=1 Tax=Ruthenibacterium intestinale TaxID=3133163 RepID=A0ABV1GIE1_9FIRM